MAQVGHKLAAYTWNVIENYETEFVVTVHEVHPDFGASGGASITMSSGFGINAAIDLLAASESIWTGGIGVHYVVN